MRRTSARKAAYIGQHISVVCSAVCRLALFGGMFHASCVLFFGLGHGPKLEKSSCADRSAPSSNICRFSGRLVAGNAWIRGHHTGAQTHLDFHLQQAGIDPDECPAIHRHPSRWGSGPVFSDRSDAKLHHALFALCRCHSWVPPGALLARTGTPALMAAWLGIEDGEEARNGARRQGANSSPATRQASSASGSIRSEPQAKLKWADKKTR